MKQLIFLLLLVFSPVSAQSPVVVKVEIKGAIGPAHSIILESALQTARKHRAAALVVELDTPGGLSTSMRDMIQSIANSPIPVITYVAPRGARAASAGTYLLYASHVAAMSPGTNLGAATPVTLANPARYEEGNGSSTLEKKALNDAVAYLRSLAQMNERNATWTVNAVKTAQSLSAEDALRMGVIDIVVPDTPALLEGLEGKKVKVLGRVRTLHTANSTVHLYEAEWKSRFLAVVTDPNIAYVFLLVAVYGIFFEMMNPGAVVPGVVGAICAVIALYSLNMLPFNYAGLLLIGLGIAFIITEMFVPGFGVLGIGGTVAFAFGSLLLFDADTLGSTVSLPLVIAFSVVSLAFFGAVTNLFVRSRSVKIVSGAEELIGAEAEVVKVDPKGYRVLCHGEIWLAASDIKLAVGEKARVTALNGLILRIKPYKE